ncbi:hypothetical protein [Bartonella sp. CB178]|uniref:hypothetical protein n=1 Tax=Bartonella sp. CB178 TaxID=3112255 RepID=UPI00300DD964
MLMFILLRSPRLNSIFGGVVCFSKVGYGKRCREEMLACGAAGDICVYCRYFLSLFGNIVLIYLAISKIGEEARTLVF